MPVVLIVAAHPDDEILGCGGIAAVLSAKSVPVRSCIMSGVVDARHNRPHVRDLQYQSVEAQEMVSIQVGPVGDFPNIRFNTVPHVELVRWIEDAMRETEASVVFTHHPTDLNDDHRHTSLACQAAVRLSQRRSGITPLQALYFMEIPSSTDWSFDPVSRFVPTAFVELGEEMLDRKIEALSRYEGVMRPYPHPRSAEVLRGLAAQRGAQAGMRYAEAFQAAFQDLGPLFGV